MQIHQCPANPPTDIQVIDATAPLDDFADPDWSWDGWILRVQYIAKKEDVIMHEAEAEGEVMWSSEFPIAFCPFCGLDLNSNL